MERSRPADGHGFEVAGQGALTLQWWSGSGQSLQVSERPLRVAGSGQESPAGAPASNDPPVPKGHGGEQTGTRPAVLAAKLSAAHDGGELG